MTLRVDFQSRMPIGRVTVGGNNIPVYPSAEMTRALRLVQDSVNAVESGLAASEVINVPAGSISATDVQSAINELDTEKASASSVTSGLGSKQPLDATLTAIAETITSADKLLYWSGVDVASLCDFTAFARTFLDDANAGAARSTLGLGSIATQSASNVSITGGTVHLASGTLGYATGNGGTDVQLLNKSSTITINDPSGEMTMANDALAAGATVSFTFDNNTIGATDVLILNHVSGGTFGAYALNARCAAGSAQIDVTNRSAVSLSEAIVIRFALVKAATS